MGSFVLNIWARMGLSLNLITKCVVSSIVVVAASRLIIYLADNLSIDITFSSPVDRYTTESPNIPRLNKSFKAMENVSISIYGLSSVITAHTSES